MKRATAAEIVIVAVISGGPNSLFRALTSFYGEGVKLITKHDLLLTCTSANVSETVNPVWIHSSHGIYIQLSTIPNERPQGE